MVNGGDMQISISLIKQMAHGVMSVIRKINPPLMFGKEDQMFIMH